MWEDDTAEWSSCPDEIIFRFPIRPCYCTIIMAEDASLLDRPRLDQKIFSKHSWRGKLFSNDERSAKKVDKKSEEENNVADFLKSATNKQPPKPHPELPIPRIDTSAASRWPTAAEVANSPALQSPVRHLPSANLPKVRRGKGLNVKFTSAEPDIIGEGGDDSEVPPCEVSRVRARTPSPLPERHVVQETDAVVAGIQLGSETPQERLRLSMSDQEGFRPQPLRRIPTGFSDLEGSSAGHQNLSSAELDSPVSPLEEDFAISHRGPGLFDMSRAGKPANARTDGEIMSNNTKWLPSPPPPAYASDDRHPTATRTSQSSAMLTPMVDPGIAQAYSQRPSPSPQPLPHGSASLQSSYFPSILTPGGPRHDTQPKPPKPDRILQLEDEPAPEASSKPSLLSLRSAVHAVGNDALDDFSARVEHYNSIFYLAAESLKPIMETTFVEWIRAGTWWFLEGRGELETAIRYRPRSADGQWAHQRETAQPLQAYVNLAKAWWIIKHITPQHPELRRFGNASMGAMAGIVRNLGNEDLVQLIEMHQAIVANLRALTMSMKKNNLLPPHQGQSPLGQGLDTSIWIQYPFFKPEIQSLLSNNVSRSMVLERSQQVPSLSDTMPLSDTKRRFNYGRKFVDVTLSSDDDQSQEYHFPCVISIMRDRTDWQIEVALASQNGLVNISIQPDKKLGLAWCDVQWEVRLHAMRVKLPRGFELYLQFQEVDFKMLWEMYEHNQKTEACLQAGPGEDLLYETTLKDFQYVDPRPSKAFPPEPSKRCRIRLFARKITRSEPTGQRKLHCGYRLVVVTSPKVKTVSCIRHVLGTQRPILFSHLRGENGAPALLLQIPEDKVSCTLIMTFHDTTERTDVHSLLNGTAIGSDENSSGTMLLRSFSIERIPEAEGLSSSGYGALETFEWKRLRVIKKDWENIDQLKVHRLLSENFRICMDCRYGSFTDHVNLGQSPHNEGEYAADPIRTGRVEA